MRIISRTENREPRITSSFPRFLVLGSWFLVFDVLFFVLCSLFLRGDNVRHQRHLAPWVLPGDHHCVLDVAERAQPGLDLAHLDPVAADLDLEIGPADKLDRAVGQPPPQVAHPIQPS